MPRENWILPCLDQSRPMNKNGAKTIMTLFLWQWNFSRHNETNSITLTLFWEEEFQRDLFYASKVPALQCLVLCRQTTMKLTPKWKKPKTPVQQGFSAKEKVRYHPNYEIWTNKGKYRLKKANISRFWLIFFDFENILRNNYAPFGCNYAPDWCIFLHLVIIKIGEINELKFKDKLQ